MDVRVRSPSKADAPNLAALHTIPMSKINQPGTQIKWVERVLLAFHSKLN